jgi:MspA
MLGRRSSAPDRRWRTGVASATVPLMLLLAALLGAPAQAEPVDLATQQYSKTTRDGWNLAPAWVITELPMANMALSDGRAMLDMDNIHIKADACGGDVAIRSSTDSRGTNVDFMGDEDQRLIGMPGSRLGNAPFRMSQVGPTTSVRTTTGTGGVGAHSTNLAGGLEDPHGNPSPVPAPGNEGTYVETPPIPGAG